MSNPLRTYSIIFKCSSMVSVLSSTWLLHHIASNKRRRKSVYHRIMFGMSTIDLIVFLSTFIGGWAIPKDTTRPTFQPMGNEASCQAQGFIITAGSGSLIYNINLMIYYLFRIKYNYKEEDFGIIEPIMHAVTWGYGISCGIVTIAFNLLHNATFYCWIAVEDVKDGGTPSFSEHEINVYRWVLFYIPVWSAIMSSVVIMATIYRHIFVIEKETEWLRSDNPDQHKMSRDLVRQAFLYVLALLTSWLCQSLVRVIQAIEGHSFVVPETLVYLQVILLPLHGFLNVLVFAEKAYRNLGRNFPNLNAFEKISIIFHGDSEEEAKKMSVLRKEGQTENSNLSGGV